MNINITFSYIEKMRLLNHASNILHGGHWGSSDLLIPEQQQLLNIIEESDGPLDLPFNLFKMLVDWVYEGTHEGTHQLPEDISIISKLSDSINQYYNNINEEYIFSLNKIKDTINIVNGLLSINITNTNEFKGSSLNDTQLEVLNEIKSINNRLYHLEELINNLYITREKKENTLIKRFKSIIINVFFGKNKSNNVSGNNSFQDDLTSKNASEHIELAKKQAKILKKKGIRF